MAAEASKELTIPQPAKHYASMQSAPRFPLHLPVEVMSQSGACAAETQNISANGVLFSGDVVRLARGVASRQAASTADY